MTKPLLWVPNSSSKERTVYFCRICKREYPEHQRVAYTEHVVQCGENHADLLIALNAEQRKWAAAPDPEWAAYNQDLERRGIDPDEQYSKRLKSGVKKLRES